MWLSPLWSDRAVPAPAWPRASEGPGGGGSGPGADPAAGRSRGPGPAKIVRLHHQYHGLPVCPCTGPRDQDTTGSFGPSGALQVRNLLK